MKQMFWNEYYCILIFLLVRIKYYIIFLTFNNFFSTREKTRFKKTWYLLCRNNVSNTINILSLLHNDMHYWFVIKVKRSGRLIYISPKYTAHISIRGFRVIYETGSDGFTSIECVSPAVSTISTHRDPHGLSRIITLQS